jgi:hypothetical protein
VNLIGANFSDLYRDPREEHPDRRASRW